MVCCLPPMNPGLGTPGSIHGSWCVFLTLGPRPYVPGPSACSCIKTRNGVDTGRSVWYHGGSPVEREPRRWTRNRGSGGGGGFGSRRTEDLGRASKSSATGGVAGSQDLRVPWSHGPGVSGFAPGRWGGIEGYSNGPLPKKREEVGHIGHIGPARVVRASWDVRCPCHVRPRRRTPVGSWVDGTRGGIRSTVRLSRPMSLTGSEGRSGPVARFQVPGMRLTGRAACGILVLMVEGSMNELYKVIFSLATLWLVIVSVMLITVRGKNDDTGKESTTRNHDSRTDRRRRCRFGVW
jgi:hypothetical protein